MKKFIIIVIIFTLILYLTSCNTTEPSIGYKNNECIYIWTDEETGVQYIVFSDKDTYGGKGGITPRLNADGSLYITKESE